MSPYGKLYLKISVNSEQLLKFFTLWQRKIEKKKFLKGKKRKN
jgi:hypothetical protein